MANAPKKQAYASRTGHQTLNSHGICLSYRLDGSCIFEVRNAPSAPSKAIHKESHKLSIFEICGG